MTGSEVTLSVAASVKVPAAEDEDEAGSPRKPAHAAVSATAIIRFMLAQSNTLLADSQGLKRPRQVKSGQVTQPAVGDGRGMSSWGGSLRLEEAGYWPPQHEGDALRFSELVEKHR